MFLLSTAFILSDWMYNYFTFSEYILFIIMVCFILTVQFNLHQQQITILIGISLFFVQHLILQYIFNETFLIQPAVAGGIKMMFYLISITVIYNYIDKFHLRGSFLRWNNLFAAVVILIGIYITFELYRESRIAQEVFWEFTRKDSYSYYFESDPSIIRTRSLFSEPAHLGFYLNTILSVNLLSNRNGKEKWFYSVILSIGILLTFSYSMILIMVMILILKVIKLIVNNEFEWQNWMIFIPLTLLALSFLYWDTIQVTLIDRTVAILSGEDTSARMRLLDSWQYISKERFFIGNGIGHTPVITNIYAYLLSDMGIIGLVLYGIVTGIILIKNWTLGFSFILLNSAKGGYLSSGYWFMILFYLLFIFNSGKEECRGIEL